MNYFNKSKIIFWLVVLIFIINLSALVTFLVYNSRSQTPAKISVAGNSIHQICNKLSLSAEQSRQVEIIQKEYNERSVPIIAAIRENRGLLLDELSKDNTDTLLINKYITTIGDFQEKLQQASAWHFLSLKKICNPDQCKKLSGLYYDLYGFKDQERASGQSRQHRFRGGRQNR